jgi:hypothetical protein
VGRAETDAAVMTEHQPEGEDEKKGDRKQVVPAEIFGDEAVNRREHGLRRVREQGPVQHKGDHDGHRDPEDGEVYRLEELSQFPLQAFGQSSWHGGSAGFASVNEGARRYVFRDGRCTGRSRSPRTGRFHPSRFRSGLSGPGKSPPGGCPGRAGGSGSGVSPTGDRGRSSGPHRTR